MYYVENFIDEDKYRCIQQAHYNNYINIFLRGTGHMR